MQVEAFIASRHGDSNEYQVGPCRQVPTEATALCPVILGYDESRYDDGNPLAITSVRMVGASTSFRSSLFEAMFLLASLFDDRSQLQLLGSINPQQSVADTMSSLSLDATAIVRPDVKGYAVGHYLAPTQSGWRLYLVEDWGEITPVADSISPALLAFVLWNRQERQRIDLAGRMAKFIPPNAATIING